MNALALHGPNRQLPLPWGIFGRAWLAGTVPASLALLFGYSALETWALDGIHIGRILAWYWWVLVAICVYVLVSSVVAIWKLRVLHCGTCGHQFRAVDTIETGPASDADSCPKCKEALRRC